MEIINVETYMEQNHSRLRHSMTLEQVFSVKPLDVYNKWSLRHFDKFQKNIHSLKELINYLSVTVGMDFQCFHCKTRLKFNDEIIYEHFKTIHSFIANPNIPLNYFTKGVTSDILRRSKLIKQQLFPIYMDSHVTDLATALTIGTFLLDKNTVGDFTIHSHPKLQHKRFSSEVQLNQNKKFKIISNSTATESGLSTGIPTSNSGSDKTTSTIKNAPANLTIPTQDSVTTPSSTSNQAGKLTSTQETGSSIKFTPATSSSALTTIKSASVSTTTKSLPTPTKPATTKPIPTPNTSAASSNTNKPIPVSTTSLSTSTTNRHSKVITVSSLCNSTSLRASTSSNPSLTLNSISPAKNLPQPLGDSTSLRPEDEKLVKSLSSFVHDEFLDCLNDLHTEIEGYKRNHSREYKEKSKTLNEEIVQKADEMKSSLNQVYRSHKSSFKKELEELQKSYIKVLNDYRLECTSAMHSKQQQVIQKFDNSQTNYSVEFNKIRTSSQEYINKMNSSMSTELHKYSTKLATYTKSFNDEKTKILDEFCKDYADSVKEISKSCDTKIDQIIEEKFKNNQEFQEQLMQKMEQELKPFDKISELMNEVTSLNKRNEYLTEELTNQIENYNQLAERFTRLEKHLLNLEDDLNLNKMFGPRLSSAPIFNTVNKGSLVNEVQKILRR